LTIMEARTRVELV